MDAEDVLSAAVESNEDLIAAVKGFLSERDLTAKEFSERSGMPANTLYKILSGSREDFLLSNLKRLIRSMREIDQLGRETSVGVITSRGALDSLRRVVEIEDSGKEIHIREYPAMTIEEEIIQGIRAEREGMTGIICGPIAANTLEKVVRIPVVGLRFEETALEEAIVKVSKKIPLP